MDKLVSILVPVYNVEKHIELCLHSIFGQSYSNIEYVFVDDCTPDKSVDILCEVLNSYPERRDYVKIIRHLDNKGIACVRNTLLNNATGDYICFVDSDDWIERDTIECLLRQSDETGADIVASDYFVSSGKSEINVHIKYASTPHVCLKQLLAMEIKPVLWILFVKRSLYQNNNISFSEQIDIGEDYIVCAKLFYYAKTVAVIETPFYHYVVYNEHSYSTDVLKFRHDTEKAIKYVEIFFIDNGGYDEIVDALNIRKVIFKIRFLLEKPYDIERYINCFPEVEPMCISYVKTWKQKLLFRLIEKRHIGIVKFLIRLKNYCQ